MSSWDWILETPTRGLVIAAVVVAFAGIACGPGAVEDERRPNIVLVLVDALRADALGAHGASPSATPVLDGLAENGLVFRRAYSNAPKTVPSVASLFTSTPPWVHRIEAGAGRSAEAGTSYLADELLLAPEVLDGHGYHTGMVTTTGWITPEVNYDQGVDEYVLTGRADAEVVAAAEAFVARNAGEPFFAYVHLLDLHDYYHADRLFADPVTDDHALSPALLDLRDASPSEIYRKLRTEPERFTAADATFLRRAYERELAATDAFIGAIVDALEVAGVRKHTILAVTSDHGEQFGEHGTLVHGGNGLYDEVLRVPLIVTGPGVPQRRSDDPVGSVDVFPILFDLAGIPVPELFTGSSPDLDGPLEARPVVSTSGSAWRLTTRRWAYIQSEKYDREELYDLSTDPGQERDLAAERPEVVERMRELLGDEITRGAAHPYLGAVGDAETVRVSPEVERTLRSLGYLD